MSDAPPGIEEVRAAARRIRPHVHRTPVATSRTFDAELGAELFFKCENMQKVGAFKARGAVNAVLSLSEEAAGRGVITHSSGNHGAALAYAAGIRGVPCTVVMPDDTPAIKADAMRGYGAVIVACPRSERQKVCDRLQAERGSTLVHPFEDPAVIAGQGTVGIELLDQVGPLDWIVAPVGGGGLLAGTAISVAAIGAGCRVVGAEPEAADDAARSLRDGRLRPAVAEPDTCCDGLMTGLGRINFTILRDAGVEVVTVSEADVVLAARDILERMKLVVEPSGATVLAALRKLGAAVRGKRVGAVFSGGNTDLAWLAPVG